MRQKNSDPPTRIELTLPQSLLDKLNIIFFDEVRGRVKHGARTRLFTNLAEKWIKDVNDGLADPTDYMQ